MAEATIPETVVAKPKIDPEVMMHEGRTYHVPAKGPIGDNQELARHIILVGDPERVGLLKAKFDRVVYTASHREIVVATGWYHDLYLSVISTGMGTDNTEIVVVELYMLNEMCPETREWRKDVRPLVLCRLGTCGSPRPELQAGDLAITSHAMGGDPLGRWYHKPGLWPTHIAESLRNLEEAVNKAGLEKVHHYFSASDEALTNALERCGSELAKDRNVFVGATYTAPGFYGPQGRLVGPKLHDVMVYDVPALLSTVSVDILSRPDSLSPQKKSLKFGNIEMEAAALLHFAALLGYQASALCLIVAARTPGSDPNKKMTLLADQREVALHQAFEIIVNAFKTFP